MLTNRYVGGYDRSDVLAPQHPLFKSLPSGGMLDCNFYKNILPIPLMLLVHELSAGRFM